MPQMAADGKGEEKGDEKKLTTDYRMARIRIGTINCVNTFSED